MSSVACETLLHRYPSNSIPKLITGVGETKRFSFNYSSSSKIGGSIRCSGPARILCVAARAGGPSAVSDNDDVVYRRTFRLKRTKIVEGEIYIKLDPGVKEGHWQLIVGCNLPGKWILRWGVHFVGDAGSEWDQPPRRMRPQGSVAVKDYAVDTPMRDVTLTEEGDRFQQVKIDINTSNSIASISFILRDEETGLCFQNVGRDFKVPLADYFQEDAEQSGESLESCKPLDRFHEEQHVLKTITLENSVHVSVSKCGETANNLVHIETDILEDVIVHWGVCKDDQKKWELPPLPHPPDTKIYNNRALHTKLQPIEDGTGNTGLFTLDKDLAGLIFVLRLGDGTWLQYMKNDFFIPLQSACRTSDEVQDGESREKGVNTPSIDNESEESSCEKLQDTLKQSNSSDVPKTSEEEEEEEKQESSRTTFTNGLIKNIRDLVRNISSEKKWIRKSKNTQESLLTEIEKLAAQAYSIFRSNIPSLSKQKRKDFKAELPTVRLHPATGTGYEILCQGFNWESHKSGKWYIELHEKADYLSSLGFTIIWLPPPTESVSPEGYMPKDLYNLNSRYGTIDQLKAVISKFHEVGIKVLGDVVLNHRCASYQNHNGVWNIFGGRLNWDDRAVVGDDPHFQGRGNKSSGDNFHAAPNIDHSQDFVRRDIKEWMRWLKNEVGYDGWRLDFVRGFWGGYVKDYLEATEPYFSVGEYWDSLSYTYSEMDYDQNAHRQRIIDWIKNTDGYSGAFDVTTKGILHSAVGNCQYWRLRDPDGKPPGVVGWWPSRAVTFIENHDTGSTQGHWRFPTGKEMQGYTYILTHPGTPSIFYDHFYSSLHAGICKLVAVRRRNKLHCRSDVQIVKAEKDLYAAIIDDKVAMKIGPGHYEPSSDRKWSLAIQGDQYKVWETL